MNTFLMQISGQAESRFYGHLHILAKYCGFDGQPWLNGYLQHGWNATDGFGNYLGSKRVSNKFVWSKRCEEIIRKNGKNNVFAIGAPWVYLEDVYPLTKNQKNENVIAYPAHTSTWSKMGDTSKEYSEYLKDKYGSVTVVLHRYDYAEKSKIQNFESLGHKVTTHGVGTPWEKGFDLLFLKKQRDLIAKHSLVVSNTLSTAVLYATSLGLDAEIGGPIDYSITNNDDKISQAGDGLTDWNSLISDKNNQKTMWKNELGLACKKSPEELKQILKWDQMKKKSYIFFFTRSLDLVKGSNKSVSLNVFKTNLKKNHK
jgi:hypothetical protein